MRERVGAFLGRVFPAATYQRLVGSDWGSALDAGLSSTLFDIEANIRDGDSRAGLDEAGMAAVHRIMTEHNVVRTHANKSFDEARLRHHRATLAAHNIDPRTGLPLDAKAVTRL